MGLNLDIFRRRWLWTAGLVPRLLLLVFVVPHTAAIWFSPFLASWLAAPSLDPWTAFLASGGTPLAFPYGPAMFLTLLPGAALGAAINGLTGWSHAGIAGYGLGVLVADIACLLLLARLGWRDKALACMWLSPAVILISYWHGQNDLIPVAFMLAALLALRDYRAGWAGAALGLAIAAKFSMVLAVPFFAVYIYRNARLKPLLAPFLTGLAVPVLFQLATLAFSAGAREMVIGTPEAQKAFQFALELGNGLQIYILPVVYLLVLFTAWRLRRMSFDLLVAMLGIVFLLVVILTPASPGWFIWVTPFLALHAAQTAPRGLLLVFAISLLQALSTFIQFSGASIPVLGWAGDTSVASILGLDGRSISILASLIFTLGLLIAYRMWREGIQRNALYRLTQRPLVLGIAGDSGAGKDTLALGLAGLFGEHAVASVGGDDYHRWDRVRPMWNALTHLNPRANDLERMTADVLTLADGGVVSARHYDHATGRFTKPRRIGSNDVIIVSGLHALLVPALRARYDVSVYLDMDTRLRRYFKIRRDVNDRGHALEKVIEAMERRQPDAERFIHPQRENADIIFSLRPVHEDDPLDPAGNSPLRLKLCVELLQPLYSEALARTLIAECGLHVNLHYSNGSQIAEMSIEGDVTAEDIAFVADIMVPNLEELVALKPVWHDGVTGLMQLIVLTQAAYSIRVTET